MIGGLLGVVGMAVTAGGIAAALLNPTVSLPGNIITAGHLTIEVNQGESSGLSFANLAPGDTRTADQLLTGDLTGVSTADLALALGIPSSTTAPDEFLDNALLSVSYSEPSTPAGLGWTSGSPDCSSAATWNPIIAPTQLSALDASQTYDLGEMTHTPLQDAICVRYTLTLDASTTNPAQGASIGLTLNYSLTQTGAVDQ